MTTEPTSRHQDIPVSLTELERLRGERDRYRIAWRGARTRARSTGDAADRYASRVNTLQSAVQDGFGALLAVQMERDELRKRVAELEAAQQRVRADLAARPAEADVLRQAAAALEEDDHLGAAAELLEMANQREHAASDSRWKAEGEFTSAAECCDLHQPDWCCDLEDCGPCCEECPTCPTLVCRRAAEGEVEAR